MPIVPIPQRLSLLFYLERAKPAASIGTIDSIRCRQVELLLYVQLASFYEKSSTVRDYCTVKEPTVDSNSK